MTEWNNTNKNKTIFVNRDETYYVNYTSKFKNVINYGTSDNKTKRVSNYHTVKGEEVGYKLVDDYYNNGQIKIRNQSMNGLITRILFQKWFIDGQLKCRGYYDTSLKQDVWKTWYKKWATRVT